MHGLRSLSLWLLAGLSTTAWAGNDTHRLTWDVKVDGQVIGSRSATITIESTGDRTTRVIESFTDIKASFGPVQWAFQQRLTVIGERQPAAFHSVMKEDGVPREVQARWDAAGWTVTVADGRSRRTFEASPQRIDMSTADLIDPGARTRIGDFTQVKLLSAETGDVWEGAVSPLGTARVRVGDAVVDVQGYAWESPAGRSSFWYDENGWLVQYQMRLLGRAIEGVLRNPPPLGADTFPVRVGGAQVEVRPL